MFYIQNTFELGILSMIIFLDLKDSISTKKFIKRIEASSNISNFEASETYV